MSRRLNDTTSPDTDRPASIANFRLTGLTRNSVSLAWDNPDNLDVVIVTNIGFVVTANPVDGHIYSGANAGYTLAEVILGANKVTYNSTSNAMSVSGLTAITQYSFKISSLGANGKYNCSMPSITVKTGR